MRLVMLAPCHEIRTLSRRRDHPLLPAPRAHPCAVAALAPRRKPGRVDAQLLVCRATMMCPREGTAYMRCQRFGGVDGGGAACRDETYAMLDCLRATLPGSETVRHGVTRPEDIARMKERAATTLKNRGDASGGGSSSR